MSRTLSEESIHIFIGHFLWEKICLEELCVSKDLNEALTEGLAALTRQEEVGITVKFCFFNTQIQWNQSENLRSYKVSHVLSKLNHTVCFFISALTSSDQTSGVSCRLPDKME